MTVRPRFALAPDHPVFLGPLHDIAHAGFVAPEDFARVRAAGAVIEYSPYIWLSSPILDGVAARSAQSA